MVQFILRYDDTPALTSYIAENITGIYRLASIFENNNKVITFTVSDGGTLYLPDNYGFGHFNKWKTKLYD